MSEEQEFNEQVKKKLNIDVEINPKQIQELANENERLKMEAEDLQEAKKMFEGMKVKAAEELTALGIETTPDQITTNEEFSKSIQIIKKLKEGQSKNYYKVPSGNAPLNYAQYGKSNQQTFGSVKEMIDVLRRDAHHGNKEAKKMLEIMTQKVLRGTIEAGKNYQAMKPYDASKDEESDNQRIQRYFRERTRRDEQQ